MRYLAAHVQPQPGSDLTGGLYMGCQVPSAALLSGHCLAGRPPPPPLLPLPAASRTVHTHASTREPPSAAPPTLNCLCSAVGTTRTRPLPHLSPTITTTQLAPSRPPAPRAGRTPPPRPCAAGRGRWSSWCAARHPVTSPTAGSPTGERGLCKPIFWGAGARGLRRPESCQHSRNSTCKGGRLRLPP